MNGLCGIGRTAFDLEGLTRPFSFLLHHNVVEPVVVNSLVHIEW